ncbi:MAG: NADPH:quinone oxidoreductase family protein [Proteobacteria bacterium]|nr:NADPH:quinone oxidoreductase family protein [Pseudomonadota bacterium]
MRAVLCERWGEPEVLRLGEIEAPEPGAGEVRLAVHAAGVNFADILMVAGKYQEKPPFPFTPGMEVAGVVEAVGAGVTRVKPGERVLALPGFGGFAESALAQAHNVFAIPEAMDFVTAAGFAITYGTALGALVWRAALEAGELLLVHGAAGGVGLAAVEVGKTLGATVIATARGADKLAVAEAHGADHLIDTGAEDVRARVKEIAAGLGDGRGQHAPPMRPATPASGQRAQSRPRKELVGTQTTYRIARQQKDQPTVHSTNPGRARGSHRGEPESWGGARRGHGCGVRGSRQPVAGQRDLPASGSGAEQFR